MITIKELRDTLEYWIFIGIGEDIVVFRQQRPEYKHLVNKFLTKNIHQEDIPELVLKSLDEELRKPLVLRPTFYHLLTIKIQKTSGDLCRYIANTMKQLTQRD